MKRRPESIVFGIVVGLLFASWSYQWITNPDKRAERDEEERIVQVSRVVLSEKLALENIEFVDPLAPQRKVGKVYVYRRDSGWEISGFYRRDEDDRWHPYLMGLDAELNLLSVKLKDGDPALAQRAATDALIELTQ